MENIESALDLIDKSNSANHKINHNMIAENISFPKLEGKRLSKVSLITSYLDTKESIISNKDEISHKADESKVIFPDKGRINLFIIVRKTVSKAKNKKARLTYLLYV